MINLEGLTWAQVRERVRLGMRTERRTHDWIAFCGNDRTRWEAGSTEAEALGKLVITMQAN